MKLVAGVLLVFMSVVHVIYGEKMQVDVLKQSKVNNLLIGSYRAMSLQGGILLFAVGLVEILVYFSVISLTGFAIYIPIGIICLNLFSVLIVAIVKHRDIFKATIPQFFIFLFIITIQALSII